MTQTQGLRLLRRPTQGQNATAGGEDHSGGGHAGNNGVRSMIQDLGSPDFVRVRCGVGRPGHVRGKVADHVLGDFGKSEIQEAKIVIQEAADAVEDIVKRGAVLAMNRFNVRKQAAD